MAWRDKLQKGSFRGAPFFWQKSDSEVGRKTARHDYPLRDEAYIEDLGKAPREFTLDVLVIGPDYMAARDRLIAALETPGPGVLVHPTHGTMRVALKDKARFSESTAEGGMARFTLSFVQAADNKQPTAAIDTAGAVMAKADAAVLAVKKDVAATMNVAKKPAFILGAAQAMAQSALDKINAVRRMVAPPLIPAEVTKLVSTLSQVRGALTTLINTPFDLAGNIQGLITDIRLLTNNPLAIIKAYTDLFGFGSDQPEVPQTTGSRISQAINQAAIISLIQTSAVIEAARTTSQVEFGSYQEAQQLRGELIEQLDQLLDHAADDVYIALLELRLAVITDITARGANLARIVPYTPKRTLPALVIAYHIYGDAAECDNLVSRNRIRHPGFVPGGVPLEVLTNA